MGGLCRQAGSKARGAAIAHAYNAFGTDIKSPRNHESSKTQSHEQNMDERIHC